MSYRRIPAPKLVPVPNPNIIPERDVGKAPILECRHLGIEFGRTEIAGLIGPNGAGKTTVFNLLTKVYQPTRGTILLDGRDTAGMNTVQVNRAGIARTFQNIRLFKSLTVLDNVLIGMHNDIPYNLPTAILRLPRYWKEEKRARERALELLSIFDMQDLRHVPDRHHAHRARHEPGHGHLRGHRRAQLRPDHRQGHGRGHPEQPGGHQGLPGQREGGMTP